MQFNNLLVQLNKKVKFDFLVFCALEKERAPYAVILPSVKPVLRGGIDCWDIEVGGRKGTIILLPQMGLVNAAVIAGVSIDRFKPNVIAMSGICGGFKDKAEVGQLMVSRMAYEYQSGKWTESGFEQEPYQVPTEHFTLARLKALLAEDDFISKLEEGYRGKRPPEQKKPVLGIFTSGSAVITDKQYMEQIQDFHRKVNALDMEVFAVKRAAELALEKPASICAKTVVDLGDSGKNDDYHTYGSYISARFIKIALEDRFAGGVMTHPNLLT